MLKKLSHVTGRLVVASFIMMMSLPALGQIGREPIESAPESGSWMAFVLAIFFGIAVAIGCLMTPRRSHQD